MVPGGNDHAPSNCLLRLRVNACRVLVGCSGGGVEICLIEIGLMTVWRGLFRRVSEATEYLGVSPNTLRLVERR